MNKEAILVERLKSGDTRALAKTVETFSDYVRVVARNFSCGALTSEDIDEIVSDVFFKLWRCRDNLDADIGLRPYLSASVKNAVKNRFKQSPPPCGDISELDIPSALSVDGEAERGELMKALDDGLKLLPDEEREIFFRYYFYGEKSPEIAKTMKLAENTVYTKLRRTRNRLKEYLTERGFDHV